MPRPRKNVETVVKSFSIEKDVYTRLRSALAVQGRSVSEEVNEFLKRRLAELEGTQPTPQEVEYEALKREYAKLVEDSKRYVKMLKDTGSFEDLHGLALDYGLDFKDMHNADEVIPRLLAAADVPNEAKHIYISLLEVAKKKREVGRKLGELRMHIYCVREEVSESGKPQEG